MELISSFREAILNLLSAKLRSFLAILGVLVGTCSVVALISSTQLATAHILNQFKKLGTNIISVYIRDEGNGQTNNQARQFQLSDVSRLKRASSQVVTVAPYTVGFQSAYFGSTNLGGQIIGATESFQSVAKLELERGRFISYLDKQSFFCVIGSTLAAKIKKTYADPLGNQIRLGKEIFTVVGILKKWPENYIVSADINSGIIIPLKTSYFLSKNTHIDNILLRLIRHPDIDQVKTQLTAAMQQLLPKKKVDFNSPKQLIDLIAKQRESSTLLLIAIGSISLIVGGIGVMNIMLVSVVERRREIGIRMAIGARQLDILRMFLIESILLTIFGGALGVAIGVFASYLIALFSQWEFYFYVLPVVLGFAVSVLVGIISGFYPAWRASKLDPIQAMSL